MANTLPDSSPVSERYSSIECGHVSLRTVCQNRTRKTHFFAPDGDFLCSANGSRFRVAPVSSMCICSICTARTKSVRYSRAKCAFKFVVRGSFCAKTVAVLFLVTWLVPFFCVFHPRLRSISKRFWFERTGMGFLYGALVED